LLSPHNQSNLLCLICPGPRARGGCAVSLPELLIYALLPLSCLFQCKSVNEAKASLHIRGQSSAIAVVPGTWQRTSGYLIWPGPLHRQRVPGCPPARYGYSATLSLFLCVFTGLRPVASKFQLHSAQIGHRPSFCMNYYSIFCPSTKYAILQGVTCSQSLYQSLVT
jgi:hypothetical protein